MRKSRRGGAFLYFRSVRIRLLLSAKSRADRLAMAESKETTELVKDKYFNLPPSYAKYTGHILHLFADIRNKVGGISIGPINKLYLELVPQQFNSMIKATRPRVATGVCSVGRESCTSELTMIKLKTPDTILVLRNFLQVMTSMKTMERFCKHSVSVTAVCCTRSQVRLYLVLTSSP